MVSTSNKDNTHTQFFIRDLVLSPLIYKNVL